MDLTGVAEDFGAPGAGGGCRAPLPPQRSCGTWTARGAYTWAFRCFGTHVSQGRAGRRGLSGAAGPNRTHSGASHLVTWIVTSIGSRRSIMLAGAVGSAPGVIPF